MGQFFFLFIILICILTDLGGYTFGKIFKGPKLTKISPNKTYSGVVGSFLFSIVLIELFVNSAKLLVEIGDFYKICKFQ